MPAPAQWEIRVHKAVIGGQFVALTIGVIVDFVSNGMNIASVIALVIAATYTVGTLAVPIENFHVRFGAEAVTLTGALMAGLAVTLTGGPLSPYLLLSMGPPVFATLHGGPRAGLTTGLLSGGLITLITLSASDDLTDAAPAVALYLVFVLLIAVIRRLLEDIHQRAEELAIEKASATKRLENLEEIHSVLVRLSEDVSAGRLNAVEVGAETLDTILRRVPGSAGKLYVEGETGLVTLASRGDPPRGGNEYELPITTIDAEVGVLELVTPDSLTDEDRAEIVAYLRPLGIAFANLQLLQDIAGSAVAEERVRLARELHDDIGPALASLGLALDMAAMSDALDDDSASNLKVMRTNVTKLVEDVRAKVADLRSSPGPTLTARLLDTTSTFEGEPTIVVDIDERRPPRPALIADLTSIVTEAARNAHKHAQASKILVSGRIHRDWGNVNVRDDGTGFDPVHEPEGHFGLIGMRERAEKIGATIKFDSQKGLGTTVSIDWGNR